MMKHFALTAHRTYILSALVTYCGLLTLENGHAQLLESGYWGGLDTDMIRAVATSPDGQYTYLAGGIRSTNVTFSGSSGTLGDFDVFVIKRDRNGNTVWSRRIGSNEYDRAYAIDVDEQGNVYIAGRAGRGYPTTAGSQPFLGRYDSHYGYQCAFLTKLTSNGDLESSTYLGTSAGIRDLTVIAPNRVAIFEGLGQQDLSPPSSWFNQSSYLAQRPGGGGDATIATVDIFPGAFYVKATYIGGSGYEAGEGSIQFDPVNQRIVTLTITDSPDVATAPHAYQTHHRGLTDFLIASCDLNLSHCWQTYLGGSNREAVETHELEVDPHGDIVVASTTISADFPTTPGAYQENYAGSGQAGSGANTNYPGDGVTARLNADLSRLMAATYFGGSLGEGIEGVAVSSQGEVTVTGGTASRDLPTTTNAAQSNFGGMFDGFVAQFSRDLTRLQYATYFGGSNIDVFRSASFYGNEVRAAGTSRSNDFPVRISSQQNTLNVQHQGGTDATLAAFQIPSVHSAIPRLAQTSGASLNHLREIVFTVTRPASSIKLTFSIPRGAASPPLQGEIDWDQAASYSYNQRDEILTMRLNQNWIHLIKNLARGTEPVSLGLRVEDHRGRVHRIMEDYSWR